MEGLGNVLNVVSVDTSHGDTTVIGQIDVVVGSDLQDLLLGEASEGEHTNLRGNVRPVLGGTVLLEVLHQESSHINDTVSHLAALLVPLSLELRVAKNDLDNTSTIEGRVGPEGTGSLLELRGDSGLLLSGLTDDRGATASLSVKTKVLGKGLGEGEGVALLSEVTNGPSVALHITGGEALVGAIEDDVVVLGLDGVRDLLPVVLGGVDTSGVVGAGVEEEGRAGRSLSDGLEDGVHIESLGLGVEVLVGRSLETGSLEDTKVVGPGGEGDVDSVEDVVLLVEVTEETEGTGAGKGLAGGDSVLLDDLGVLTVGEGDGELVELWETIDGRILVVHLAGDHLLSLEDAGENDGLAVVVSVGTDAEGDLSGVLIGLELLVETQNGIRGSLRNLELKRDQNRVRERARCVRSTPDGWGARARRRRERGNTLAQWPVAKQRT